MQEIKKQMETLVFCAEEGISLTEIKLILEDLHCKKLEDTILENLLEEIKEKYKSTQEIFALKLIGGHYRFLTKELYYPVLQKYQALKEQRKLGQAALETLAIIAYKQPITKLEVEQIRGVNCDYSIQRLLERSLIHILGKSESVGRPLLYGTSMEFMNHFGLKSLKELPRLKEIIEEQNTIGEENTEF